MIPADLSTEIIYSVLGRSNLQSNGGILQCRLAWTWDVPLTGSVGGTVRLTACVAPSKPSSQLDVHLVETANHCLNPLRSNEYQDVVFNCNHINMDGRASPMHSQRDQEGVLLRHGNTPPLQ